MPNASEYGISQASNPVDLSGIDPAQIYKAGLDFRNNTRQYQASQAFMRLQKAGNDPNTPEGLDAIGKGLANAGLSAEGEQYLKPYRDLAQSKAVTQQTQLGNQGLLQDQLGKVAEAHSQVRDRVSQLINEHPEQKEKLIGAFNAWANNVTNSLPPGLQGASQQLAQTNNSLLTGGSTAMQNIPAEKAGAVAGSTYTEQQTGNLMGGGNNPTQAGTIVVQKYSGKNRPINDTQAGQALNELNQAYGGADKIPLLPKNIQDSYAAQKALITKVAPDEQYNTDPTLKKDIGFKIKTGEIPVGSSQAQSWIQQNPAAAQRLNLQDIIQRNLKTDAINQTGLIPKIENAQQAYADVRPILEKYRLTPIRIINELQDKFGNEFTNKTAAEYNSLMTLLGERNAPLVGAGAGTATALHYVSGLINKQGGPDAILGQMDAGLNNIRNAAKTELGQASPYFEQQKTKELAKHANDRGIAFGKDGQVIFSPQSTNNASAIGSKLSKDKMNLAFQALKDPDATPEEKAQAKKILGLK